MNWKNGDSSAENRQCLLKRKAQNGALQKASLIEPL